jgi:TolB-like protein
MAGAAAMRYVLGIAATDPGAFRPRWAGVVVTLAALFGAAPAAAARSSTVAVMPFRDLSSDSRYIGEAIRETVMTDLKQLGGLRVVERGNLDRVLAEQNLQAQKTDLDLGAAVRVGKVLGAQLIVVGAYQKLAPQVRLTARFIKVETSEIVGTAKVDGSQREFLRLQDRVTAALLRSAGLPLQAKQVLDDSSRRPELESLKTLDLYGQAVVSTDDTARRNLLTLVLAEDKNFSYAAKDLEALEQRLQQYQVDQNAAAERDLAEQRRQLALTTDRALIEQRTAALIQRLVMMGRYRAAATESRNFLSGLGPGAPISQWVDTIANFLVLSDNVLRDEDALLRDGENFLRRAPGSSVFFQIKQLMQTVIDHKRKVEEGKAQLESLLATLSEESRWDLCAVAGMYRNATQLREAQRLRRACLQVGGHKPAEVLPLLLAIDVELGDWASARADLAALEKADPVEARKSRSAYSMSIPVDG